MDTPTPSWGRIDPDEENPPLVEVWPPKAPRARRRFGGWWWVWVLPAVSLTLALHGVGLLASTNREQERTAHLAALVDRLDGMEKTLRGFEQGITPSEYLPGATSEREVWARLVSEYRARADSLSRVPDAPPALAAALAGADAAVGRMAALRDRVIAARSAGADVTPPEIEYHRQMALATESVESGARALRDEMSSISLALVAKRGQMTALVWVACLVALLAIVVSAMYRRDIGRRRKAEEDLDRVHAELELRVEERTAELSLANALLTEQIRERQRTEERLQRYASRLARSNAELQEFAYVASHDLQEPLRMVASYVQLLARRYHGRLDSDADEFIRYAVDGAERMKRLILDLLAYARVDSQERSFTSVSCGEVLSGVLHDLKVAVEESDATIEAGPLPTVDGDPIQLAQLLQNLVGNAIKFRGAEPPRIRIRADRRDDEHVFRVSDNGIGIDPDHFDRIFRVFQRLQPRDDSSGTGIGLAICKKIVERHGGRIWVESAPARGTTMLFTLPVRATERFREPAGVSGPSFEAVPPDAEAALNAAEAELVGPVCPRTRGLLG